jgi:tol-pal system protein YbgF
MPFETRMPSYRRLLARAALTLGLTFAVAATAAAPARAQDLFGLGGSDAAQRRQAELNLKINALEGQIRNLNGQIETLTFQMRQMQDLMARMQKDVDFRLQEIESGAGAASAPNRRPPPKRTDAGPQDDPPVAVAGRGAIGGGPGFPPPGAGSGQGAAGGSLAAGGPVPPAGIGRGPGAPPQVLGQIPADGDQIGAAIGGSPLDLSGKPSPASSAALAGIPKGLAATPPVASSRDEYDSAYGYILNGEYGLAETSFKTFLANHPTDNRVGSAQYWLGESFFARNMNKEAADAFLKSYTQFPDGPKAPDSLLKLGLALNGLGERKAACTTYEELLAKYPKASKTLRDRAAGEKVRAKC